MSFIDMISVYLFIGVLYALTYARSLRKNNPYFSTWRRETFFVFITILLWPMAMGLYVASFLNKGKR